MPALHLRFEYELPQKAVYEWFDLSGTGYVGMALKSIKPIGKEGEKILVKTRWRIIGVTKTLLERTSAKSLCQIQFA